MPSVRVLGVVSNRPAADQLVGNLRLAGFGRNDVSFIVVKREAREAVASKTADQTGRGVRKVLRGVGIGAALGLVAGCVLGFVISRFEYFNVLPDGVLIAACGVIVLIVGALIGAFSTETPSNQVIERYGMELREGQAVITVDAPDADAAKTAEEILNTGGATKVNSFLVQEEQLEETLAEEIGVAEVKPESASV